MGPYCLAGGEISARPNFYPTFSPTFSADLLAGLLAESLFVETVVAKLQYPNLDFRLELLPRPLPSCYLRTKPTVSRLHLPKTVLVERHLVAIPERAIVFPDLGLAIPSSQLAPDSVGRLARTDFGWHLRTSARG